jgi:tRNA A-37 threonylcarbamoyl transferase component Bud32/tetratricopeptide (TPR) repeat protein
LSDQLRALELFEAAIGLPAEERAPFLDGACGDDLELRREVTSLLEADRTPGTSVLDRPALGTGFHVEGAAAAADRPLHCLPARLGRYLVLEELGAGAMGVVYRAEQDQPRRQVALKLMAARLDTPGDRARFAAEAQALALLRHPGIAQIHDAGTLPIEGRELPFLAMELVEGLPLSRWAAERRPPLPARIALVVALGQAVDAAHRSGVVHRDLKPDNILVEESDGAPRARILDFGVARIVARVTEGDDGSDLVAGTRAYMSPEQAEGIAPVDARADVYSLGVIAYELFAGARPNGAPERDSTESRRGLPGTAAMPLLPRDRRMRGDLELVIQHALARLPEHRYQSAGELAADLQRVLERRPVSIRRPTPGYLLRCFGRREPLLCASLVVTAVAVVVALVVGWSGYLRARATVERLIEESRLTVDTFTGHFSTMAGTSAERSKTLAKLLPQVATYVEEQPDNERALECLDLVLRGLGDIAVEAGRWQEACGYRERGLAVRESLLRMRPEDLDRQGEAATAVVRFGDARLRLDGRAAALALYRQAHETYLRLAAAKPTDGRKLDDLAWSCDRVADLSMQEGDLDEAERLLARRRDLLDRLRVVRPGALTNLSGERSWHCLMAQLELRRGRPECCRDYFQRSIAPARERCLRAPNCASAMVEFAGSVLAFLGHDRTRSCSDDERARLLAEARGQLERLLVLEPAHLDGRHMLEHLAGLERTGRPGEKR